MLKLRRIICTIAASLVCLNAVADEGMWCVNAINSALEKRMRERGLKLKAKQIYDADAEGASISDAIVSLDFGCTGSIVSETGLLITNHHCAYSDVHSLSTEHKNYLEEGFYARTQEEEVHIKGKGAWFLKQVYDVTEEVDSLRSALVAEGKPHGSRRLTSLIERKYSTDGMEAYHYSMWSGKKHYVALYKVYKDVRLVVAPPVCIAAFGADIDNWEWPQHKGDFAMYRVYASPEGQPSDYSPFNIPLRSEGKLRLSTKGYKKGDFAMVMGYPGRTDRYSSSAETRLDQEVTMPDANRMRGEQMNIISKWMNSDPKVRLLYADYFFGLSNVQELYSGQVECVDRFGVIASKQEEERQLQSWLGENKPEEAELLSKLDQTYDAVRESRRNTTYYRESLVRGTRLTRIINHLYNLRSDVEKKLGIRSRRANDPGDVEAQKRCYHEHMFKGSEFPTLVKALNHEYSQIDLRVEKELFKYAVSEFYAHVDSSFWGEYQKKLARKYGCDKEGKEALASYLWSQSIISDTTRLQKFLNTEHSVCDYCSDPLIKFFRDISIQDFNKAYQEAQGSESISNLKKRYTHAVYDMRQSLGVLQYPDANSSMRLTFGTIGDLHSKDAVCCNYQSTAMGIVEKYRPTIYDFNLNEGLIELYRANSSMPINFICDCDITGGNSGSPVLNAKGELIGLAFDGNKESLASNVYYTPGYNKCVCVDIRFVLWVLRNYMGADRILQELGQ